MNCLVSGATGFIGRQLCQQLSAGGHSVAAFSKHGGVLADGLPVLQLDLTDVPPGDHLLNEVDILFHLAGVAHRGAHDTEHEALNHRATLRLARQASASGS